jgi:hypothetical protein
VAKAAFSRLQKFLKKPIAQSFAFAYIPGSVSLKETDSITCETDN